MEDCSTSISNVELMHNCPVFKDVPILWSTPFGPFSLVCYIGQYYWLLFRYLWMFLCLWISRKNRSENGFVTLMAWCNRKTITKSQKKLQNGMIRVTDSQEKLWYLLWTCPSEIYIYWSCLFIALLDEISGFLLNLFIFRSYY